MADGKEQTLANQSQWDIGGIRRTSHTHDSFLTRDGDDYVIEVRGRNGETVARATVIVVADDRSARRGGRTDAAVGRGGSGSCWEQLNGVTQIRFSVASGLQHARDLELDQVRWADEIHTTRDRPIQLPLADAERQC